ncbi:MAG: WD40 repeat domain-containing protein [Gemmataceae bacterium]
MPGLAGLSRLESPAPTLGLAGSEAKPVSRMNAGSGVESLAFSPNRHLLLAGCADGTARVWDITTGTPAEKAFVRLDSAVRAAAFSANSRMIVAGSANGVVKLFDLSSGTLRDGGLLRGSKGAVEAVAFSPDNSLVAAGGADMIVRLWETGKGLATDPRAQIPGHTQAIRAIVFATDGHSLATGSADTTARIWALNRIRPGQQMSYPHGGEVATVAFAPDGRSLVAAGREPAIWLWDASAAKATVRARLDGPPAGTSLVQYSSDGETIVSANGNLVMNWSPRSGRLRASWSLPPGAATRVAVTADGRYLARGDAKGGVELFRVAEKRK